MLSVRLLGRQPMIKGRPRNPNFHLIELLLSDVIVANITIDNATIIAIQINQVTFDMVGDGMKTMGFDSVHQIFWEFI